MRFDNIRTICVREYLARVRTRAFWISTVLVPLLMIGFTVVPTILTTRQQGKIVLGLEDETGRITPLVKSKLAEREDGKLARRVRIEEIPPGTSPDSLARMVADEEISGYVVITEETVKTGKFEYRAKVTTNVILQEELENLFTDVFSADRLRARGFDPTLVQELTARAALKAVDITGGAGEAAGEARFVVAYVMFFLLYTMQIFYGQNVMRGVLEEKTSRIVEVIISSVKPTELMAGKLLGIGGVALTQILIWLGTTAALSGSSAMSMVSSNFTMPHFAPVVYFHFAYYFVTGFFLYATLFAVVGSMNNNEQEAQQMSMLAMMPVIIPAFFVMPVINDPNSPLAVGLSIFPLFTPLLMMARVAVGAAKPLELAIADPLLLAFLVAEVVVAARIYRVGILMYGKRPTIPEIIRWARYR